MYFKYINVMSTLLNHERTNFFSGRNSIRDANYGSPFIRELVKTLYKHSSHRDLVTLFDIVSHIFCFIVSCDVCHVMCVM